MYRWLGPPDLWEVSRHAGDFDLLAKVPEVYVLVEDLPLLLREHGWDVRTYAVEHRPYPGRRARRGVVQKSYDLLCEGVAKEPATVLWPVIELTSKERVFWGVRFWTLKPYHCDPEEGCGPELGFDCTEAFGAVWAHPGPLYPFQEYAETHQGEKRPLVVRMDDFTLEYKWSFRVGMEEFGLPFAGERTKWDRVVSERFEPVGEHVLHPFASTCERRTTMGLLDAGLRGVGLPAEKAACSGYWSSPADPWP